MRRPTWYVRWSILCLVLATPAGAGERLKTGWTPAALASASAECTEALVQGTWENTKREQGGDPSAPLTDDIRKKLAPEIASMKKLCACAVREGAKRYTKAEAEAGPADLEHAVSESISKGICRIEP